MGFLEPFGVAERPLGPELEDDDAVDFAGGTEVAQDLLTGNMVDYSDGDVEFDINRLEGRVTSTFLWEAQSPGFEQVMGRMDAEMTVTLGPPECLYETRISPEAQRFSDNVLLCQP